MVYNLSVLKYRTFFFIYDYNIQMTNVIIMVSDGNNMVLTVFQSYQ